VADARLNAFGCIFVEMWVLSEDGAELFRPEGGHWMNPAFASSLPNEEVIKQAWELDRHAEPTPPGAGLAMRNRPQAPFPDHMFCLLPLLILNWPDRDVLLDACHICQGIFVDESGLSTGSVNWRQIKVLLKDTYVQRGPGRRLERMHAVGIGLVASVPFYFVDRKGVVLLFYSRKNDPMALQSSTNTRYMIGSANLIGASYSIRRGGSPRRRRTGRARS